MSAITEKESLRCGPRQQLCLGVGASLRQGFFPERRSKVMVMNGSWCGSRDHVPERWPQYDYHMS